MGFKKTRIQEKKLTLSVDALVVPIVDGVEAFAAACVGSSKPCIF